MGQIALWNNHSFTVSPTLIRSFTGLTIKGGSETEEKTSDNQNYAQRKNGAPSEVSLTAELNALTGCDVKNEAMQFVQEAHEGKQDYFYIGNKKLLTCQLMLTEAQVSEIVLAPSGAWISCKVALTMVQCSKMDGTTGSTASSSSSSGSKKTSVKTTPVVTTSPATDKTVTAGQLVQEAYKSNLANAFKNKTPLQTVTSAAVSKISDAAKKVSSAAKAATNAKTTAAKVIAGKAKISAVAFGR